MVKRPTVYRAPKGDRPRAILQFCSCDAALNFMKELGQPDLELRWVAHNPQKEIVTKRGVRKVVGIKQSSK